MKSVIELQNELEKVTQDIAKKQESYTSAIMKDISTEAIMRSLGDLESKAEAIKRAIVRAQELEDEEREKVILAEQARMLKVFEDARKQVTKESKEAFEMLLELIKKINDIQKMIHESDGIREKGKLKVPPLTSNEEIQRIAPSILGALREIEEKCSWASFNGISESTKEFLTAIAPLHDFIFSGLPLR